MTEQEENELICEKLLGWTRITDPRVSLASDQPRWHTPEVAYAVPTPAFTTWNSVGLILEALAARGVYLHIEGYPSYWSVRLENTRGRQVEEEAKTGPLALRSAALAYLKVIG